MHKELSVKSRVRGDFHARFCERVRVKLPRSTRPCDPVPCDPWKEADECRRVEGAEIRNVQGTDGVE